MKTRTAAVLAFGAMTALGLSLILAQGVEAKNESDFLPAFRATYPAAVGSRIDSCTICHNVQGSEYKLNSYARQWKEGQDFVAINSRDADGDGYTNLQEIDARTFPGNASDNPSTVTTTTTVPGATTTTAPPGSGSAIYQANCVSCHGGNGGNLVPTTLSLSRIVDVVRNGRGTMPGYSGSLTSAEIQLVSEYLFNWGPTATTTTTTTPGTPPPPPPDGSALYRASCAGCHGANGGDLAGTSLNRSQLVSSITNGTTTGMPAYKSTYNASEISAIADYLLSLGAAPTTTTTTRPGSAPPPPPSGASVYSSNCAACHGAAGGDLVGRNLTTSRISTVTNNGTTGMPGFSSRLSPAETSAVVAYVAGKAGGTATTTTTKPGTPPPSGASVYSSNCAACHGAAGGDLVGRNLTTSRISTVTNNGTTGMPGFSSRLSPAETSAVVAYVAGKAGGTATTTTTKPGTPPPSGASVYSSNCAACHGAAGGDLVGHVLSDTRLASVISQGTGTMPGYASRLGSADLDAVVAYVSSLGANSPVATPGATPVGGEVEGTYKYLCATCHGADGEGRGTVAPFGENLDAAGVAAMIRNGGARMPGFPDLTEESLDALVAHTLLLANGEPTVVEASSNEDLSALSAAGHNIEDDSDAVAAAGLSTDGQGLPMGVLAVIAFGILGFVGGIGYSRTRAARRTS